MLTVYFLISLFLVVISLLSFFGAVTRRRFSAMHVCGRHSASAGAGVRIGVPFRK
jgi:hypothetical protein